MACIYYLATCMLLLTAGQRWQDSARLYIQMILRWYPSRVTPKYDLFCGTIRMFQEAKPDVKPVRSPFKGRLLALSMVAGIMSRQGFAV